MSYTEKFVINSYSKVVVLLVRFKIYIIWAHLNKGPLRELQ
jgi:hypothetical protein